MVEGEEQANQGGKTVREAAILFGFGFVLGK
jgi:hypothetical protein